MERVDYFASILFKNCGDMCCLSWPSSLLDELSVYKNDSNKFFSTVVVY